MSDAYRTPGAVDMTEVEIARIKEAQETRRHARDLRYRFLSYDSVLLIGGICLVGIVGCLVTIAIMAAHSHWYVK